MSIGMAASRMIGSQQSRRKSLVMVLMAMLMMLASNSAWAQDDADPCGKPTDKRVLKLLDEAAKAKDAGTRHKALKASLELDPECAECTFQLGLSAYRIGRESGKGYDAAQRYFEQLQAKCPEYHSDVPYHLGAIRYGNGEFAAAAKEFTAFMKFPTDDASRMGKAYDKQYADVQELMPELQFYVDLYKNTSTLDPRPLANVNQASDEYLPMLSPDNELLFFTRVSKVKAKGDIITRDVEELTEARRPDTKSDFSAGRALPDPFNQGDSYGGVSISVNNKEMFVTVCTPADARGYRNCDIFRTHYDAKFDMDRGGESWEWTGMKDLGPEVNSPDGWESQPSLSADGRTIYFAAQRENTEGMDILQSTRDASGKWSKAVPVKGINTPGDEKAPFMHSDSRTLYFAARQNAEGEGHRGIGGYDIFYSRMNEDGSWGKPKNIGHPINTDQDEHGLIVSADGRTAYFASNRFKGAGGLDIYGFELPKEARPDDILVLKGEVRDENGAIVKNATVEVKYMDTRKNETIMVDQVDGTYATVLRLKAGDDVVVTVKKPDHVFDSRSFSVEDTIRGGTAKVDMTVQKIAVGQSYRVNDIKYATSSAAITKSSEYILDELITFLKENPSVKIRIEGHTDNVGRVEDNMSLSNDRAFTVMEYLQEKGVKPSRLTFQGMGPTKPMASNDTPEGRAENRRTEFVITGR